tara:strand:- start:1443 stop:2156 length:714 start_codon:yes stop_codon:yes gene_type:complete
MATFIEQVKALTSIDIDGSSTPTQNELSQFLKDGVMDVTSKHLAIRPQDAHMFTRVTAETTSNDSLSVNGSKIVSVVREAGTDNDWRECREIPIGLQSNVTDSDSLHYASKYNPAYMVADTNKISVFPAPGSDPNSFKVYYVNKDAVNGSGSSLVYSHDDILYFPISKVYLVVTYAAIKSLEAKLAFYTIEEEDEELVRALQVSLQQLQVSYGAGFLPDKNYEAALQSQGQQRRQRA